MGRRRRCRFKCPFLGPQSVAKAILWFFLFFPLFSCLVVPKAMITANDYRVPSWVEWEKDTKLANVQRFPIDTHIDKCGRNVVGVGLRPYQCLSSGVSWLSSNLYGTVFAPLLRRYENTTALHLFAQGRLSGIVYAGLPSNLPEIGFTYLPHLQIGYRQLLLIRWINSQIFPVDSSQSFNVLFQNKFVAQTIVFSV